MSATLFDTDEQVSVAVPAGAAAVAWLNAFLAASRDEARPALYRTLSVEFFATGVQLVGCDGTALFRTWAPVEREDGVLAPWPEPDEAPERAVVVMDANGFAAAFMQAVVRITGDAAYSHERMTLETVPFDEGATLALGSEFRSERLTVRACGQRIDLQLFEGAYPNWRVLKLDADDAERVEGMMVAPRLLGLLGKLKGVRSVDLRFHGENLRVDFECFGEHQVRGLVMPMRRLPRRAEEE